MGKISFAVSESTIVLGYHGKTFRIKRKNQINEEVFEETDLSKKILHAIRNKDLDTETSPIPAWVDIEESFKGSPFFITNGHVYIDGVVAPKFITTKIIEYKELGIPYESIVAFHRNVLKNPSESARQELFLFLEHNGHPLTEEGYFLAYKAVRSDFYSKYNYSEGSKDNILNAPQTWVETPREGVDSDRNRTCSHGLHCANYDYAKNSYGSHGDMLIELIVDPKDVVTVPSDYNNKKMRVCRYFVVGPSEGESTQTLYKDWNQGKLVDNNAPTNMVTEGDCDTSDEAAIDYFDNITIPEDVKPIVSQEITTGIVYYKTYVNAVGVAWTFKRYDAHEQILVYSDGTTKYDRQTKIKKGFALPISWKPTGPELTGLWPTKAKGIFPDDHNFLTISIDSTGDELGKKINTSILDNLQTIPVIPGKELKIRFVSENTGKSEFAKQANAFINAKPQTPAKVDTKLNHLSQTRVNGKFAKKNP